MKKFSASQQWSTDFTQEGVFEHLNQMVAFDEWHKWPSPEALQSLMPYEIHNNNNKPIQFVAQSAEQDFSAVAYEELIYQTGQVPTRQQSWHDLFGALIWCLFPLSKALINELHFKDIQQYGTKTRSARRNALTLFDECGVILVTKDEDLVTNLRQHQWQQVFIERRNTWHDKTNKGVHAYQFGHANYEMLTKPYIGLTGKFIHLSMSAEVADLPLNVQYRMIDKALAQQITDGLLDDNTNLSPLPLLGVPGWFSENENLDFYGNTEYFRTKS